MGELLSLDELRGKVGFDVDTYVRDVKTHVQQAMGRPVKIRLFVDHPSSQAMSKFVGPVLEIHMAPRDTIRTQKPELSEGEITAKYKAAIAEEICHGIHHETSHDERVVGCTLAEMGEHMSPEELRLPYIQEKMDRLRQASQPVVGTPIAR
ncbi:MAG: hypothetical protein ACLP9K_04145 [Nitrososphaerales archaeon]